MKEKIDPCVHLGIGIDTARYAHHVSFLDEGKRTAGKPFHFTETPDGYAKFREALDRLAKVHRRRHLHIHIDAAGQYAENLLQWLHGLPFEKTISVGQPARNKAYRKVHFDKRKADPAESLACARFAIVERPEATPHNPPEFQQLRDIVALREAASKHETQLVNQLHGLLARVFPELAVHVTDISANYVLTLLERYPTPDKLARAQLETLVKIPHLDPEKAETLHAAAKNSLGSNQGELAAQLIHQKVRELRLQQSDSQNLDELIEKAWNSLPEGPYRRILTIKGIGIQTAAALVAKIVDIDRFETDSALIGYFGVFPEEVDVSGTDRHGNPKKGREIRMCRKGNDLVRRLLYTAAQCAATWNPPVKALYARQRAAGKVYNVAIGRCMAKLLRQVFALWKKNEDFDPDFESRPANEPTEEVTKKDTAEGLNKAITPKQEVTPAVAKITSPSKITRETVGDKLPPLDFARLRQMVTITQVLEHLDWQPRNRKGDQWRGPCLFHEGADPQGRDLAIDTHKSLYHCHKCHKEGNVIDFWVTWSGKEILPAAWDMVRTFGLEPPLLGK